MGGVYSTEQRVVANLARIAGKAILGVYASRFEVRTAPVMAAFLQSFRSY
jgi:hypothetical protein